MKTLCVLLVTLLMAQVGFGQELKTVRNTEHGFSEYYSVLNSDNKIRQGDYKRYSPRKKILIEGKYDNNQKIGEWKFYVNEELEQAFDFSTKQLMFSKTHNESCMTEENGQLERKILDTPPMYLGSSVRLEQELRRVVKYPRQAQRMGIEGTVFVSVWIDVNNEIKASNTKGISGECDAEVLEALNKIDKDWVAGTIKGVPIKSEYIVSFQFKLNK